MDPYHSRACAANADVRTCARRLPTPTVPIVAPRLEELAADADYARINALVLRNSGEPGEPPVGPTLFARGNTDRRLFCAAPPSRFCSNGCARQPSVGRFRVHEYGS